MAKTAAERQAAYRASRYRAGVDGNGERRINTWVSTRVHLALERLAQRYGVTQRAVLERLIEDADNAVLAGMAPNTAEWETYLRGSTALRRNDDER